MTDFKITPEDVGRVAICGHGIEWHVQHTTRVYAMIERLDGAGNTLEAACVRKTNGNGQTAAGKMVGLTHWKPRTLEAPNCWWVVYRDGQDLIGFAHADWASAGKATTSDMVPMVARIYGPHWHGCEEGCFDEPGKNGVPEDA